MCYFIGGDKFEYDLERISEKGANIVVATPGRIHDLITKGHLNFKKMEMLIMDEADKLLDTSNAIKMQSILDSLPKQRRTGLFSATMPTQVKNLVKTGMRNPFVVEIKVESMGIFASRNQKDMGVNISSFDPSVVSKFDINDQINNISEIPQNLTNYYKCYADQSKKLDGLKHFLLNEIPKCRIIIFFATCASVNFHFLALEILFKDIAEVYKLHGKIDQKKRSKIYSSFKKEEVQNKHKLLLTTDLSSRGIDIPDVEWII